MAQESIPAQRAPEEEPTDEITARQARRIARKGMDGSPSGSTPTTAPAAAATRIDARDHADLRETLTVVQRAQHEAQQARDRLQQAGEAELAARGAYGFVSQRIRQRYALALEDQVDPETGEIVRAVAAGPNA